MPSMNSLFGSFSRLVDPSLQAGDFNWTSGLERLQKQEISTEVTFRFWCNELMSVVTIPYVDPKYLTATRTAGMCCCVDTGGLSFMVLLTVIVIDACVSHSASSYSPSVMVLIVILGTAVV